MLAVYSLFGLLIIVAVYLLIAPVYLEINTSMELYQVRFHRFARARLNVRDNGLFLRWQILGMGTEINLLSRERRSGHRQVRSGDRREPPLRKMFAVIRTFKVNKFSLQLDTGSMALNGLVFPLFAVATWRIDRDIRINFMGRNELVLEIENNALRMMRAYLFSKQTS